MRNFSQIDDLRYSQQSYQLRGLLFDVRNRLRAGWSEEIYHEGIVQAAKERGIPTCSKPRRAIIHRGVEIHLFECDLIFWDQIIVELKALPLTKFAPSHRAQLISYLKCWQKGLGLLANLGPTYVEIQRIVWDEPELLIVQDYTAIESELNTTDRAHLEGITHALVNIGQQYGLGYSELVYQKLAAVEIEHNGLTCQVRAEIPARWNDRILANYISDHLLVQGDWLLGIRGLLEYPPSYDFARMKTYLNSLNLKFGLIANFGKKQLQIYGINAA